VSKPTKDGHKDLGSATPVLDAVIDEILRGERIVLFPPGILAFVATNLAVLFGSGVLFMLLLELWTSATVSQRAVSQLLAAGLSGLLSVIPGALVAIGIPSGQRIEQTTVLALLVLSILVLAAAFTSISGISAMGSTIAVTLLGVGYASVRTAGYRTYALFRQRLRQRRGGRL
jgi:hypothetical protein